MLVAGRDFSEEMLARIRLRVEGDSTLTRTALSREVCRWLGWQGADGQPKDMSCRMALLKLARRGHIDLPAAREVSVAIALASDLASERWRTGVAQTGETERCPDHPVRLGAGRIR